MFNLSSLSHSALLVRTCINLFREIVSLSTDFRCGLLHWQLCDSDTPFLGQIAVFIQ